MKQIFIMAVAILVLGTMACNDDDDGFQFDPALMHYDGANANAPVLPAGNVELAAQFGEDAMSFYEGQQIEAVSIYMFEVPTSSRLVFYGRANGDRPGQVLYQQDITNELEPNGWNTIPLDEPFDLPSDELWISYQLPDGENIQSLGCDAGPARSGGDWMFESSDNEWRTFRERANDNINWNIRAVMSD